MPGFAESPPSPSLPIRFQTYVDAAETAVANVGPEMVSLAETGSSMLRRRLDEFALDAVDFHDDEDALHNYEEEMAESKHARRERRRRRRERRAKRMEEQMLADEAEMGKEEHARHEAKKYRNKKSKKAQQAKKDAQRKAALTAKGATFQARGDANMHVNETDAQRKARKRMLKNRKLTKQDKKLYKKIQKLEKQVKRHNAIAKELEAKANYEHADKNDHREQSKWAKRDRSTAYAVSAGVSQVTSYQGQLETEDLHADRRFWDSYYGKKHKASAEVKNDLKHESLDRMVKNLQQNKVVEPKKVDRSIELYKAAHVASFSDAYGTGSAKALDANLKEDGDKYIQFFQELN